MKDKGKTKGELSINQRKDKGSDEMSDMMTQNNIIDGKLVRDISYDDKVDDVTSFQRNMEIGENQVID